MPTDGLSVVGIIEGVPNIFSELDTLGLHDGVSVGISVAELESTICETPAVLTVGGRSSESLKSSPRKRSLIISTTAVPSSMRLR